ncbi:MAG: Ig-like domain-containing protein, partial [Fuerstiella sp.]|nr:Ig-like domain-containing protein [Fuerstiella sp.]
MTITGPGADLLTIDADNESRIFNINDGDNSSQSDVSISGLKLTGGDVSDEGGAIFTRENLSVTNSTISGNSAYRGGGIDNNGTLSVSNSTISGNTAAGGYYSSGGGIDNNGTLSISNSTISGNTAAGYYDNAGGGAIFTRKNVSVTNSTISGNTTDGSGGGIYSSSSAEVTVSNSTISGNTASRGGGIENNGNITVSNSTISENSAVRDGGGIDNNGNITVSNSTVSGNSARYGGGIYSSSSAEVTVSNSTISGNNAGFVGGGLKLTYGNITISNTTISGNKADFRAGGIYNTFGTLVINNSIVAGNTRSGGAYDFRGDGPTTTGSFNLFGTGGIFGLIDGTDGNIVGVNWKTVLENDGTNPTLADNGGPTQTIALLAGSPAINEGSNDLATDDGTVSGTPLVNDQRGAPFARIVGDRVDIGAFESENTAPEADDLSVSGDEDTDISGQLTASDAELNPVTFVGATSPTNGSVVVNSNGTFTYTPNANFNGADSFTFTVSDGSLEDVGNVNITVNAVNDRPLANDVAISAIEDGPAVDGNFSVTDVDTSDTHTFAITTTPTEGTVTDNGNGTFTFDPGTAFQDLGAGQTRNVTFDYTATDSSGAANATSEPGTVTVTVTGTSDLQHLVVDTDSDVVDGDYSLGNLSLREAVELTNTNPGFSHTITFGNGS